MTDEYSIDRRALMGRIALLLGATALPAEAFAAAGKAGAGKAGAKPFLAAAQFATLSAIADTVIPATDTPGAIGAGVPRKLDGMLAKWASASTRAQIVAAIAAIDKLPADGKGFVRRAPANRKALLLAHDREALKPGPKPARKLTGLAAMLGGPAVANPGWARLKDLIVTLYYNSEIALTTEVVFEPVPGQWVPSLKITPGMRPFASVGPF